MAITKDLKSFKEYELYPLMFDNLEELFQDTNFVFKKKGSHWESPNHLDGSTNGGSKICTYVYPNNKSRAIDHSDHSSKDLIGIYMQEKNLQFWEAIEKLSSKLGLTPPEYNKEDVIRSRVLQNTRERAKALFISSLWNDDIPEAKEALTYLREVRGFTDSEIKEAGFGLVTREIIENSDIAKGFTNEYNSSSPYKEEYLKQHPEIKEEERGQIGKTHTITIPFYRGSVLEGFKVREPREKLFTDTKYLNTYGLKVNEGLFGITIGVEDLTIVEGELDAIHARLKGFEDIAATGGSAITLTQLEDALKRKVKKFTLLYDNDQAGRKFTLETIFLMESKGIEPYVVELPNEVKDLDEFFRKGYSLKDLEELKKTASPSYLYKAKKVIAKYKQIDDDELGLTFKERESYAKEIGDIVNAPSMKPYNRELVFNYVKENFKGLEFGIEEYKDYLNREWERNEARKRADKVRDSYSKLGGLVTSGKIDEAISLMKQTSEEVGILDRSTKIIQQHTPLRKVDLLERLKKNLIEGVHTGYFYPVAKNTQEEIVLNAGLSLICGYRGHGKTTLLNNIALNEALNQYSLKKQGKEWKRVLYFSYEIDLERLMLNLINIYVNNPKLYDPTQANSPLGAIYNYFRKEDISAKASKFLGGVGGSTLQNFEKKYNFFLDEIAADGGILHVIDEKEPVEELLDSIKYSIGEFGKPSLVCVDYAQQLNSKYSKRNAQRYEELGLAVNDMKDFANKNGIPFLLAAQFNRGVNSPVTLDTRNIGEAGDLERLSDSCFGIYALQELKTPPTESEKKDLIKLLERCQKKLPENYNPKDIKPIPNRLFVSIMKRRYGTPLKEVILDWEQSTGYIKPNGADIDFEDYNYIPPIVSTSKGSKKKEKNSSETIHLAPYNMEEGEKPFDDNKPQGKTLELPNKGDWDEEELFSK